MKTEDKVDVLWVAMWIFLISWGGFFLYWLIKEQLK